MAVIILFEPQILGKLANQLDGLQILYFYCCIGYDLRLHIVLIAV